MHKIPDFIKYHITFSFDKDENFSLDRSFTIDQFNYGAGTFYQKFKDKVSEVLYPALKDAKNIQFYVMDNLGSPDFSFFVQPTRKNSENPVDIKSFATLLLTVCKKVHNYDHPVELTISKVVIVEQTAEKIVV